MHAPTEDLGDRRARLLSRGWFQSWGSYWRRPDGQIVSEIEAFKELAALENLLNTPFPNELTEYPHRYSS